MKKKTEEKEGEKKKRVKACTPPLLAFPPHSLLPCLICPSSSPRSAGYLDKRRRAAKCCSASFSSPIPGNLGSTVTQFLWLLTVTASIPSPPRWIRRWAWCDPGWGFGREVMVEKQMAAHCVDRAICAWFWDYVVAHAAGDPSKVKTSCSYKFRLFSVPLLICWLLLYTRILPPASRASPMLGWLNFGSSWASPKLHSIHCFVADVTTYQFRAIVVRDAKQVDQNLLHSSIYLIIYRCTHFVYRVGR